MNSTPWARHAAASFSRPSSICSSAQSKDTSTLTRPAASAAMSSSSQSPPRGRGVIARVPGMRSGILKMIASIPLFDPTGEHPRFSRGASRCRRTRSIAPASSVSPYAGARGWRTCANGDERQDDTCILSTGAVAWVLAPLRSPLRGSYVLAAAALDVGKHFASHATTPRLCTSERRFLLHTGMLLNANSTKGYSVKPWRQRPVSRSVSTPGRRARWTILNVSLLVGLQLRALKAPVLLALSVALLAARPGDSLRQENAALAYHGFAFSPGRCESPQKDCPLAVPKEWTTVEIDLVKKAIDEIIASPNGKDIAARTQQRGLGTLRRYSFGLNNSVPVPAIAAALRPGRYVPGIELHDRLFAQGTDRDRNGGYLLVAQLLLHECMHAVDDLSDQAEFMTLVGFVKTGSKWRFDVKTPAEVAALVRFDNELVRLEQAGEWAAQWRLNRTLALAMRPIRVPSMQSIRGPAEAFAEIGSHLILDPNARTYLPRRVTNYFDTNVFLPPPRN